MNMICPQTLLQYFMHLQFKFDVYDKNKNSKLIETCVNLKYIVQNNVFVVEKLKEVQTSNFL
jgi:hypothetical protein